MFQVGIYVKMLKIAHHGLLHIIIWCTNRRHHRATSDHLDLTLPVILTMLYLKSPSGGIADVNKYQTLKSDVAIVQRECRKMMENMRQQRLCYIVYVLRKKDIIQA